MKIEQEIPFEELFGTIDQQVGIDGPVPDASSGDGIARTFEQCVELAEKLNCDLLRATDRQLFIDIDDERHFSLFKIQFKVLMEHFKIVSHEVKPSKQGLPHRHIVIELAESYPLMTRVALQACLGSDPMRELLSVRRAMNEEENVVIFFEKRT